MEEIRDDKINEGVGAIQSCFRGYRSRDAYGKLYFERKGLLCAQMTIRKVSERPLNGLAVKRLYR